LYDSKNFALHDRHTCYVRIYEAVVEVYTLESMQKASIFPRENFVSYTIVAHVLRLYEAWGEIWGVALV